LRSAVVAYQSGAGHRTPKCSKENGTELLIEICAMVCRSPTVLLTTLDGA